VRVEIRMVVQYTEHFAKNGNLSWTTRIWSYGTGNPYYSSTGYTDPSRLTSGLSSEIPVAPYLLLELPYK